MMKLSQSTVTLVRLSKQMADRLERIGVDAEGVLDPDDAKLIASVRRQADKVLAEPMKKHMAGK